MTLSMYRASISVFLRGLDVLSVLLDRAVVHAAARGFDVGILVGARLAPDMLPFAGQIQRASDTAKFAAGRLTDLPSPRYRPGDLIQARSGWRTHAAISVEGLRRVDPTLAPVTTALGVLGMPGFTAYSGMKVSDLREG